METTENSQMGILSDTSIQPISDELKTKQSFFKSETFTNEHKKDAMKVEVKYELSVSKSGQVRKRRQSSSGFDECTRVDSFAEALSVPGDLSRFNIFKTDFEWVPVKLQRNSATNSTGLSRLGFFHRSDCDQTNLFGFNHVQVGNPKSSEGLRNGPGPSRLRQVRNWRLGPLSRFEAVSRGSGLPEAKSLARASCAISAAFQASQL